MKNTFGKVQNSINVISDKSSAGVEIATEISGRATELKNRVFESKASAGEAGKGFAVVAEEIRKLAENSENTVSKIQML